MHTDHRHHGGSSAPTPTHDGVRGLLRVRARTMACAASFVFALEFKFK